MENAIKMDDLGVPLFLETPIMSLFLTHFQVAHFFKNSCLPLPKPNFAIFLAPLVSLCVLTLQVLMKIQMQQMPDHKSELVKPEDALKGRSTIMDVAPDHFVLKNPMMLR